MKKRNANKNGKRNILNTIEQIITTLNFDTITTMTMKDDKGAKNKEHMNDRIS
jgi:hypothetical protein